MIQQHVGPAVRDQAIGESASNRLICAHGDAVPIGILGIQIMWLCIESTGSADDDVAHCRDPAEPSYQHGWNWCSKCQCLFFANNASDSSCPAKDFEGPHTTGGFAYSVLYNDAVAGSSQGNWWWCGQCEGLFYSSDNVGGYCPASQDGASPHISGQGSLFDPPIINSYAYDVSYYSTSSP
jgi:hypothetical protein